MFQNKKSKRNATSGTADAAVVALCASNCALPTSEKMLCPFPHLIRNAASYITGYALEAHYSMFIYRIVVYGLSLLLEKLWLNACNFSRKNDAV